jgi:hypothetical protein
MKTKCRTSHKSVIDWKWKKAMVMMCLKIKTTRQKEVMSTGMVEMIKEEIQYHGGEKDSDNLVIVITRTGEKLYCSSIVRFTPRS